MTCDRHVRRTAIAAAWVLLAGGTAAAQEVEGTGGAAVPGWVFTPSVAFGLSFDDNVILATRGDPTPDDTVAIVSPSVDLGFNSRHLYFGGGYRGGLVRHRTLDEYDTYAQSGRLELRYQPTRRVSLVAADNYSISPTTDAVDVGGIPFARTGTRQNDFRTSLKVALARALELTGTYHFQWMEFDRTDEPISALLQGGRAHGVSLGVRRLISQRLSVGGSYLVQRARLGETGVAPGEHFTIQNAEAVMTWGLSPTLTLEGGGGVSYLALPVAAPPPPDSEAAPVATGGSRTGPALRISLRKQTEHAMFAVSASRSFVPAFSFGGSLSNQEIVGSVLVPFARRRAFVQGNMAYRSSEPVLEPELAIDAFRAQTTVGYRFQRWLRVEAFYTGTFQQSTVLGGNVDRNRVGVQVVTSHPMRIY